MNKKILAIGIIGMFLVASGIVLSTSAKVMSTLNEIVVPDDYPTIQEAINNAQRGDTIRVRPGTYRENIVIEITMSTSPDELKIIGDDTETTIIDGGRKGHVIDVIGEDAGAGIFYGIIRISGFTIRKSGSGNAGIYIRCLENTIENNIIENNGIGIKLAGGSSQGSMMNTITDNIIRNNDKGITIISGMANMIYHNNFIDNIVQAEAGVIGPNGWNEAWPSGGNYWNDYTDVDEYGGHNQDEGESDGIWDHPYTIAGGSNEDMYPFVYPNGWTGDMNLYPNTPSKPSGPASGKAGTEYTYTTSTNDPDGDQVFYMFNWDYGGLHDYSNWLGPYPSGQEIEGTHTWDEEGDYEVRVQAKDEHGLTSGWSDPLSITMPKSKQLINLEPGIYVDNAQKMSFPITIFVGNADIEIDAEGANKVEFYLDDDEQPRYIDDEAPYEWLWDEFSFGSHILKVIAYDNAGVSDIDEMKVYKFF